MLRCLVDCPAMATERRVDESVDFLAHFPRRRMVSPQVQREASIVGGADADSAPLRPSESTFGVRLLTDGFSAHGVGIARDVSITPTPRPRLPNVLLVIILLSSALPRLYHFTAPPVDHQSWRQTQTLMVARNFFLGEMRLFHPQVDWLSTTRTPEKRSLGGSELNVVPLLTAFLYSCFGVEHWVGRLVPLFFSMLGLVFYHRLARNLQGEGSALLATAFLAFSPYFIFMGRVQMPESFAFAMSFATLLFYRKWIEKPSAPLYWTAIFFALLTILGKPQMAVCAIPMLYLTVRRMGKRFVLDRRLYVFAICVILPYLFYAWHSFSVLMPRSGVSVAQAGLTDY